MRFGMQVSVLKPERRVSTRIFGEGVELGDGIKLGHSAPPCETSALAVSRMA